MKLIVITPEQNVAAECDKVEMLFHNGLQRLHIRKPDYSATHLAQYVESIPTHFHPRIVIHNNFELFDDYHLGGIHLNSRSREESDVWKSIAHIPPALISTSFHSWDEIAGSSFPYGYVFISPVFDSISKSGYKGGIPHDGAAKLKKQLALANAYCPQIIGLGGIDVPEIEILRRNLFDGAAVLGALWNAGSIATKFFELSAAAKSCH